MIHHKIMGKQIESGDIPMYSTDFWLGFDVLSALQNGRDFNIDLKMRGNSVDVVFERGGDGPDFEYNSNLSRDRFPLMACLLSLAAINEIEKDAVLALSGTLNEI